MSTVTFEGNTLNLVGDLIARGQRISEASLLTGSLEAKKISDYENKVKVITTFPSLDTPVCDLQVKEFNKQAAAMAENVVVVGISNDLPFAQQRFCEANGINRIELLTDYKDRVFAEDTGLLIKELALFARAVLIVDADNVIQYVQLVKEITDAPDYIDALEALKNLA